MAVHACTRYQLVARLIRGEAVGVRIGYAGMERSLVAALTELGGLPYQQTVVVRPVHRMAVQAVGLNRRVFETERTAFFRMTFVAELIDRISSEHLGAECPMRVVAVGAGYLAFPDRVVRLFIALQPDILVTVEAEVRLSQLQAFADAGMQGMAVRTGDAVGFVL